jgi:hypothetical protein
MFNIYRISTSLNRLVGGANAPQATAAAPPASAVGGPALPERRNNGALPPRGGSMTSLPPMPGTYPGVEMIDAPHLVPFDDTHALLRSRILQGDASNPLTSPALPPSTLPLPNEVLDHIMGYIGDDPGTLLNVVRSSQDLNAAARIWLHEAGLTRALEGFSATRHTRQAYEHQMEAVRDLLLGANGAPRAQLRPTQYVRVAAKLIDLAIHLDDFDFLGRIQPVVEQVPGPVRQPLEALVREGEMSRHLMLALESNHPDTIKALGDLVADDRMPDGRPLNLSDSSLYRLLAKMNDSRVSDLHPAMLQAAQRLSETHRKRLIDSISAL